MDSLKQLINLRSSFDEAVPIDIYTCIKSRALRFTDCVLEKLNV